MFKLQVFLLLYLIPILLSILQNTQSSPAFFQQYRKKQQKNREKRLKQSAAEKRLEDLTKQYNRILKSIHNANNDGIYIDHSNRSDWIKKDMIQNKINANIRKHRLAAKVLKGNIEIKDALGHRANHLQKESNDLQKQKEELKQKGFIDKEMIDLNEFNKVHASERFDIKADKCRKVIQKNARYLSTHDKGLCNIL